MKKIITLLFSTAIFATSFAQSNRRQPARNDTYVYNHGEMDKGNFSTHDKQFQIDKLNREFDFKIRAIRNDYTLRRHQKKVAIRGLERERSMRIRMINSRSNYQGRHQHDWRY